MAAILEVGIDASKSKSGAQQAKQAADSVKTSFNDLKGAMGYLKEDLARVSGQFQNLGKNASHDDLKRLKDELSMVRDGLGSTRQELEKFGEANVAVITKETRKELGAMSKDLDSVSKSINGVDKELDSAIEGASSNLEEGTQSMSGAAQDLIDTLKDLTAAYISYQAVTGFVGSIVDATIEAEQSGKRLESALKTVGYTTGVTANEIKSMADELQNMTTFEGDAIVSMNAFLATFKNVRGDVFRDATPVILDMAAALGTDLDSAARTVGRALESPTEGLQSLRRAGVFFTASQEKTIGDFIKLGDAAEAQGVILDALKSRYEGMAVAMRDTLGGAIGALKNTWGDLFEMDNLSSFNNLKGSIEDLNAALGSGLIARFKNQVGDLIANGIDKLAAGLKWVADNFDLVVAGVSTLMALGVARWFYTSLIAPIPTIISGLIGMAGALGAVNAAFGLIGIAIAAGTFLTIRNQMQKAREEADIFRATVDKVSASLYKMNATQLQAARWEEADKLRESTQELKNMEAEIKSLNTSMEFYNTRQNEIMDEAKKKLLNYPGNPLAKEYYSIETQKEGLEDYRKTLTKTIGEEKLFNQAQQEAVSLIDARIAELEELDKFKAPDTFDISPGGVAASSGMSAVEQMIARMRDEIQYFNADGEAFLPTLDEWQAKLKPLSDDWKLVADFTKEINDAASGKFFQMIDEGLQFGEGTKEDFLKIRDGLEDLKKSMEDTGSFRVDGLLSDKYIQTVQALENVNGKIQEIDQSEWEKTSWEFAEGFMTADDYIEQLKSKLAEVGGKSTEAGRAIFSELQNVSMGEAQRQIDALNESLNAGKITSSEWLRGLQDLMIKYQDLPEVEKYLNDVAEAQEKMADSSRRWLEDLKTGLIRAIVYGEDFGDVLKNIGQQMLEMALNQMLFGSNGSGGLLGGLFSGLFGGLFAKGGAFMNGMPLTAYASGGIVSSPTLFPMAHGMGLMGEAGAEAVMPLRRMSNGDLGVEARNGDGEQGGNVTPNVIVNIENKSDGRVQEGVTTAQWSQQQQAFIINTVVENVAQNGQIAKMLKTKR